jgi:uncharacterized protein YdhG (YjbR/CyaY superfamily)
MFATTRRTVMPQMRPSTIGEYIKQAPDQAQEHLRKLYALLKGVAPDAAEAIKWGNPVFESKRILFAFSAHKTHINFAPTPSALKPFREELATHKTGKGTLQIPYDKPLPAALVRKIARFRLKDVRENDAKWM